MSRISWIPIILLLFVLFNSCSTENKLLKIEEKYPSIEGYFRETASVAEFPCSRPELFFSGDHFSKRIIQLIKQTDEYILIDSFLVLEDEMGKIILEALKERFEEGVRVYLITDSASF